MGLIIVLVIQKVKNLKNEEIMFWKYLGKWDIYVISGFLSCLIGLSFGKYALGIIATIALFIIWAKE